VLALRRVGDRLEFSVRVTPRASANAVAGEREGALRVRVTAAPVEGAANAAVVALLAKALGVAPSSIRVERGATARTKTVSVPAEAEGRLLQVVK